MEDNNQRAQQAAPLHTKHKSSPWGALWVLLLASCGAPPSIPLAPYAEDPKVPSRAVHYVSHAPEMYELLNKIKVEGAPSPASCEAAGDRKLTQKELAQTTFSQHDTRYLWGRQSLWELSRQLTGNQPTPEARVTALARWVSLNVSPRNTDTMPRECGVFPETVLWRGFGDPWECFLVFHGLCAQSGIDAAFWVDSLGSSPSRALAHGPDGWWLVDLDEGCLVMNSNGRPLTLEEELAEVHPSTVAVLRIPFDPRASSPRWKAAAQELARETPALLHDDIELMERHLKPLLPRGGRIQWVDACGQGLEDWLSNEARGSALMMARVTQGGSLQARALLLAGHAREALGLYEVVTEREDIDDYYEAQAAFAAQRKLHAWEKFQKVLECPYLRRLQETCQRYIACLRKEK